MPYDDSRAQQEQERLLFFPGKDSSKEKPWTLCLPCPASSSSIKVFFFHCHVGTCTLLTMTADPKLQFSADLK